MNRRSFISGLIRVGAFAAFNPNRVIFDMGKNLFLPDESARAFQIVRTEGLDRMDFTFAKYYAAAFRLLSTRPNAGARIHKLEIPPRDFDDFTEIPPAFRPPYSLIR